MAKNTNVQSKVGDLRLESSARLEQADACIKALTELLTEHEQEECGIPKQTLTLLSCAAETLLGQAMELDRKAESLAHR